jgi:Staphylococcal nuclease homologue
VTETLLQRTGYARAHSAEGRCSEVKRGRCAPVLRLPRAHGRRVLLRTDTTQDTFDRYDRLLAYAKLRGGPDAALSQLRAGWAKVYVYGGKAFRRVRAFRRAQRSARRADRGVWGRCGGRFHRPAARASTTSPLSHRPRHDRRGPVAEADAERQRTGSGPARMSFSGFTTCAGGAPSPCVGADRTRSCCAGRPCRPSCGSGARPCA